MSIPRPTLDDRTYADLIDEARSLIPSLAPQWTNHNPSDPGITLIELFAWLTEMLIYRVNRLPKANTYAFLRLINGRQWMPGPDLDKDIRDMVLSLRRRDRAVTTEDYEALAGEVLPDGARAHCVPRRNLEASAEANRLAIREGYVSLVIVPAPRQDNSTLETPLPSDELLFAVSAHLQPRRLLTVRQAVVAPVYVPIQAELVLARRPDVPATTLSPIEVATALNRFLDPSNGGPEGKGWPFGRDIYVSELYRLLDREIPGVDYVLDITLSSICQEGAQHYVSGRELWNDEGDEIGIELSAHHLPWPQIDPSQIAIGSDFLPIRVSIQAEAVESTLPLSAVKTAVKLLFHPLHGGPEGSGRWEITEGDIADEVEKVSGIKKVTSVAIEADLSRLFQDGTSTGVRFEAGEMADLTVVVQA